MSKNDEEIEFDKAAKLLATRQWHARRPKSAGTLAGKVITRHGVAAVQSTNEMETAWHTIAAQWKPVTNVGPLRRGKLEIIVANSMVNQQLTFEKKKLIDAMNKQLKTQTIQELTFRVGQVT